MTEHGAELELTGGQRASQRRGEDSNLVPRPGPELRSVTLRSLAPVSWTASSRRAAESPMATVIKWVDTGLGLPALALPHGWRRVRPWDLKQGSVFLSNKMDPR